MKAKRDSNPRYRTVSAYTKGLILPTIGNTNPRYRSNKNLDFVIFQDDYCCNSMVGVEDSNPKGVNTPPFIVFKTMVYSFWVYQAGLVLIHRLSGQAQGVRKSLSY